MIGDVGSGTWDRNPVAGGNNDVVRESGRIRDEAMTLLPAVGTNDVDEDRTNVPRSDGREARSMMANSGASPPADRSTLAVAEANVCMMAALETVMDFSDASLSSTNGCGRRMVGMADVFSDAFAIMS